MAPTELNVSTVRWPGARPHPAQLGPSPAALGDEAGRPGLRLRRREVLERRGVPRVGKEERGSLSESACGRASCSLRHVLLFEMQSNLFPVSSL